MTAISCPRADELLDALGRRFVGPELETHVESCADCSELRLVAGALLDERLDAIAEAAVPSAAAMWWRLQVRRHEEAEARVRRSLLIGQAATLAVALALAISLLGADVAAGVRHAVATIQLSTPWLLLLATWLVATPIAGWAALRQK
ncbi:MAG TPA: hypothetical protein VJZ76_08270 [Thermoanaerobaculia bacterium]|nr:hypothetical protein [Thermoanaerobaculia bacterium]